MPSERVQRRIDSLLDQAEEAIEAGEWERAHQRANDALALDPENKDGRTFIEAAQRRLGNSPERAPASPSQPSGPQHPDSFVDVRYRVERYLGDGIASTAGGGEILVSSLLRALVASSGNSS